MMSIHVALPQQNRSCYWDNIKGLLILLVVFAHFLYQLQGLSGLVDKTVDYIYLFHMPAFIFVSGYFGKSEQSRSFVSIIKLIFLYYIFNSLTVFIRYHNGFTSLVEPIFSYWYLLALILWRLTAHRIAKFRLINILLFALSLLIGFFPSIDNHFAMARAVGFYPFYMLGFQLSDEESIKIINRKYYERAIIGAVVLLCSVIIAFGATIFFGFSDGSLKLESYREPEDLFRRIAMFIISLLLIFTLRLISPDRNIPLITMFGRNSLWIFIFHRLITIWISELICDFTLPIIYLISFLCSIVLCAAFGNDLISKYMNRFLSSGAEIFTSDTVKISISKIVAIGVAAGFVVIALASAYSGDYIG